MVFPFWGPRQEALHGQDQTKPGGLCPCRRDDDRRERCGRAGRQLGRPGHRPVSPPLRAGGKLSADGRRLVVTGTADCAAADGSTQVSVSILQPENLAAVRGFSKVQPCTDAEDSFAAELTVREGKPSFAAGPVQACALAQIGTDDGAPRYDFWCTFVTLVVDDAL